MLKLALLALLLAGQAAAQTPAPEAAPAGSAPAANGQPALASPPIGGSPVAPATTPEAGLNAPAASEPDAATAAMVLPPHDLSPWGMFIAADRVVQTVMVGLALASLVTWTIWLAKALQLHTARRRARAVLQVMSGADSLAEAARGVERLRGAAVVLVQAAQEELAVSADVPGGGVKERVASRLERSEAAAARQLQSGMGVLATIGSTAPFVGLFGTVWGIMNAFVGIAAAQTTNLAVVAPGIAEALLATAFGLVAAIPAVVFYNGFARSMQGYRASLRDAGAAIERVVGRDLDRSRMQRLRTAA